MAPGRFEILALCGAFALVSVEGSWQTNLTAVPSDGIGGNAVLKVSWDAASSCWFKDYTYEVTLTGDHVPSKSATTSDTKVTFKDAEYWTNYKVACETSCVLSNTIDIEIYTGPGAPHAVAGIDVRPSNETAHVTVTEASLMPRPVDTYRLTYCNVTGLCNSTIISRNGPRGIVETELQGLESGTKYNLTVVPEIDFEGKVYRGDARTVNFTTHEDTFGAPRNFQAVPLNKTHIQLGWDRPEDVHKDTELFYTVTYCHSKTCEVLQSVEEPRFLAGPVGRTNNATIRACEAMADGHCGSATLNSDFKPPKKDYAAVSNISATLGEVSSDSVLCNVTWTIDDKPVKADNFTVKACSKNTCSTGSSNTNSAEVQLRHFEVYTDFSVTANYYPGLDVFVQRVNETSSKVETPGTAPGHVRNFTVKVTSNGAVISWVIPENIPEDVTNRTYIIKDMAGALDIPSVTTEELTLSNLTVYHQYNISVQMEVGYQNQLFRGEPTFRDFLTDVGTPGQVRDIEAVQEPDTNVYRVNWKPPASNETNGPINHYTVKAYNSQNAELSTMNVYGATNVRVKINNPVDNATYTFGITAVNLDNNQQSLEGEELQHTVRFHGIAAPVGMTRTSRTGTTLSIDIHPANKTANEPTLFYKVTAESTNNVSFTFEPSVVVYGLKPLANETISVQTCSTEMFCSHKFEDTFETNVAEPEAVQNLKVVVSGENDTDLTISWEEPSDPVAGYQLTVVDTTNDDHNETYWLNSTETTYTFNSTEEYESYIVIVVGYNIDLDDQDHKVLGTKTNASTETSGTHAPRPAVGKQTKFDENAIQLSWTTPEVNGWEIKYYRIVAPEVGLDSTTEKTAYNITGLKPYQKVPITLYACANNETDTVKNCSMARSLVRSTDVGTPTKPRNVRANNISQLFADIFWQEPETKNGPIDKYLVEVWETANKKVIHSTNVTSPKLTVTISGLEVGTAYSVSVMATNKNSHDDILTSEAGTNSFTTASMGGFPPWLAILLAIALVGAIVAAGVIYIRKRRAAVDDTQNLVRA